MLRNAFLYVSRKMRRTMILFLILVVVLSCLYSCFNFLYTTNQLKSSLEESSRSSLVVSKKDGGDFLSTEFDSIDGDYEITSKYKGLAKPKGLKVIEGAQTVMREDLPSEFRKVVAFEAVEDVKRHELFQSGAFTIEAGENLNESDEDGILIHEALAKENNLKVNDEIQLEMFETNSEKAHKPYTFKIKGIFSGKKQEQYTGLTSDFSENMVFMNYTSSQRALGLDDDHIVNEIEIFTKDPAELKETLEASSVLSSEFYFDEKNDPFKDVIESYGSINDMIKFMAYSILVGGILVLSLVLTFFIRERIYEIAILLSIGVSKFKIIMQFLVELLIVSIPALVLSFIFSYFIIGKIIEKQLIQSELQIEMTYQLSTLFMSYGLLVIIIIVSVTIASLVIVVKTPKELLSKMS
ncbi:ABC transporter permease [Nosocomiicoccus ampullae]|uniref:ABC transport system permease protein n=1 Tax=Nosocomiicoccus ampullae TaxID=489910 RepID=A0A9Q2CYM2_9STAP|nr:FtsX-like permease family protein [Nosocomiicoccus ampullae]MBB5175606.1 putative ABC transport system permease protein [Nosocomiicoccus ampullae]QYA47005.1 FtsX-like permease family protein [Nosocomiicoccus ampullae]